MSAGSGVTHSEFNLAKDSTPGFLQTWTVPNRGGIEPRYEHKTFAEAEKRGTFRLVAISDGVHGSVRIHADAASYTGLINGTESVTLSLNPTRKAYVHMVKGTLKVNGQRLLTGEAAKLADEDTLTLSDGEDAEVLVFDLAA